MRKELTKAQRGMLVESGPDDVTGREGCGVELCSGRDYAVAKSLERKGLGFVQGPGGPLPGMYWNSADGLVARDDALSQLKEV